MKLRRRRRLLHNNCAFTFSEIRSCWFTFHMIDKKCVEDIQGIGKDVQLDTLINKSNDGMLNPIIA